MDTDLAGVSLRAGWSDVQLAADEVRWPFDAEIERRSPGR